MMRLIVFIFLCFMLQLKIFLFMFPYLPNLGAEMDLKKYSLYSLWVGAETSTLSVLTKPDTSDKLICQFGL